MKREPKEVRTIPTQVEDNIMTIEQEEADNKRQDEYLKKYGII